MICSCSPSRLLARVDDGAQPGPVADTNADAIPVRYRAGRNRDAKRAIAWAVVELLPRGALIVGLTGGTITGEVARFWPAASTSPS